MNRTLHYGSLALAAFACACGTLGGDDETTGSLPSAEIGGWELDDEPWLADVYAEFRWPSVVLDDDGIHLFVVSTPSAAVKDASGSSIRHFYSSDATTWQEREPPYVSQPPEANFDSASVVRRRDGWWMALHRENASTISLGHSDDGVQWSAPEVVLTAELAWEKADGATLGSPHLFAPQVHDPNADGPLALGYVAGSRRWGFALANAPLQDAFARASDEPLFELQAAADAQVWERDALVSVRVRVDRTPLGRPHWRMWYTAGRQGSGGLDIGVGFAGSHDGATFVRSTENPVFNATNFDETDAIEFDWNGDRTLVLTTNSSGNQAALPVIRLGRRPQ